jgi:hypothetical protein
MKKIFTSLVIAALLFMFILACGCDSDKSGKSLDGWDTTRTGQEDGTSTWEDDTSAQDADDDYTEPGPSYDPYVPMEGEMVTASDYDLGLQEGYEDGYWAGLVDGRRGIYDDEPGGYDDSNEYYEEGYLQGYAEGYEDGYSDGEEM